MVAYLNLNTDHYLDSIKIDSIFVKTNSDFDPFEKLH